MSQSSSRLILRVISKIDDIINRLTNQILHHQDFQRLEASWRGLHFLTSKVPLSADRSVKIRMLSISEIHLRRDCQYSSEVEQTALFDKIYSKEYDHAGGIPFSLLLADYSMTLEGKTDWVDIIGMLSKIASAAFAPLIMGVEANFLELNRWSELTDEIHLQRTFRQTKYLRWNKSRRQEDARFIHFVLPRVLWRKPYQNSDRYLDNHGFLEEIASLSDYCWGSPAYVTVAMMMNCFIETGWFTELRAGSIDLPLLFSVIDTARVSPRGRLEASVSDQLEQELSTQGFIALMEAPYVYSINMRSCHSIQVPLHYDNELANINAEVATMLSYLLCACRFAHYLKVLSRDKIGSFLTAAQCEQYLQRWIFNYCGQAMAGNEHQLARYPLADARIQVQNAPGTVGKYLCKMELKPNYHIEKINMKLRFVSTLSEG